MKLLAQNYTGVSATVAGSRTTCFIPRPTPEISTPVIPGLLPVLPQGPMLKLHKILRVAVSPFSNRMGRQFHPYTLGPSIHCASVVYDEDAALDRKKIPAHSLQDDGIFRQTSERRPVRDLEFDPVTELISRLGDSKNGRGGSATVQERPLFNLLVGGMLVYSPSSIEADKWEQVVRSCVLKWIKIYDDTASIVGPLLTSSADGSEELNSDASRCLAEAVAAKYEALSGLGLTHGIIRRLMISEGVDTARRVIENHESKIAKKALKYDNPEKVARQFQEVCYFIRDECKKFPKGHFLHKKAKFIQNAALAKNLRRMKDVGEFIEGLTSAIDYIDKRCASLPEYHAMKRNKSSLKAAAIKRAIRGKEEGRQFFEGVESVLKYATSKRVRSYSKDHAIHAYDAQLDYRICAAGLTDRDGVDELFRKKLAEIKQLSKGSPVAKSLDNDARIDRLMAYLEDSNGGRDGNLKNIESPVYNHIYRKMSQSRMVPEGLDVAAWEVALKICVRKWATTSEIDMSFIGTFTDDNWSFLSARIGRKIKYIRDVVGLHENLYLRAIARFSAEALGEMLEKYGLPVLSYALRRKDSDEYLGSIQEAVDHLEERCLDLPPDHILRRNMNVLKTSASRAGIMHEKGADEHFNSMLRIVEYVRGRCGSYAEDHPIRVREAGIYTKVIWRKLATEEDVDSFIQAIEDALDYADELIDVLLPDHPMRGERDSIRGRIVRLSLTRDDVAGLFLENEYAQMVKPADDMSASELAAVREKSFRTLVKSEAVRMRMEGARDGARLLEACIEEIVSGALNSESGIEYVKRCIASMKGEDSMHERVRAAVVILRRKQKRGEWLKSLLDEEELIMRESIRSGKFHNHVDEVVDIALNASFPTEELRVANSRIMSQGDMRSADYLWEHRDDIIDRINNMSRLEGSLYVRRLIDSLEGEQNIFTILDSAVDRALREGRYRAARLIAESNDFIIEGTFNSDRPIEHVKRAVSIASDESKLITYLNNKIAVYRDEGKEVLAKLIEEHLYDILDGAVVSGRGVEYLDKCLNAVVGPESIQARLVRYADQFELRGEIGVASMLKESIPDIIVASFRFVKLDDYVTEVVSAVSGKRGMWIKIRSMIDNYRESGDREIAELLEQYMPFLIREGIREAKLDVTKILSKGVIQDAAGLERRLEVRFKQKRGEGRDLRSNVGKQSITVMVGEHAARILEKIQSMDGIKKGLFAIDIVGSVKNGYGMHIAYGQSQARLSASGDIYGLRLLKRIGTELLDRAIDTMMLSDYVRAVTYVIENRKDFERAVGFASGRMKASGRRGLKRHYLVEGDVDLAVIKMREYVRKVLGEELR